MTQDRGYLLDTNVLVYLIRNKALGQYINKTYHLTSALHLSAISVITVGEMYSLARRFGWPQAKLDQLDNLLNKLVWIDINHADILHAYGLIDETSRRDGNRMGKNDIWIAATAKATGMILLTTDKDFDYADPTFLSRIWIDPASSSP